MTQDFANVSSVKDSSWEEHPPRVRESSTVGKMLLVVALVAVVAAAFAGGHYLGQQHGVDQQKVAEQLRLQQQLKLQDREIIRLKKELAAKPEPKPASPTTEIGDLTFYDDLVNDKVNPGDNNDTAEASKKIEKNVADIIAQSSQPANTNLPIYIQLGSFADESVAKGVKQRVVALGMISYIQPTTLSGKRHRFRVRVGPYPDMKQANKAKKTLKKQLHIDGMIIRAHSKPI